MNPEKLKKIESDFNVSITKKSDGHYHIQGGLLVNYYPSSNKKTAYVAGTTESKKKCTWEDAARMAVTAPAKAQKKDSRSTGSRKKREALLNRGVKNCHWCNTELTLDTSTLEHIIPLTRGGLDNASNITLACEKCNNRRGCNMPELQA